MIKQITIYICLVFLCSCSVTIESPQLNLVKDFFNKSKYESLNQQWFIVFEGKRHEAYAIQNKNDVTFLSLEHLEVDFKHTLITSIRLLSPNKKLIRFDYTAEYVSISSSLEVGSKKVYVKCEPLLQHSKYVYVQNCYNTSLNWNFQNKIQVNELREVVFIKTFYDIQRPAIELYFNQLYKL